MKEIRNKQGGSELIAFLVILATCAVIAAGFYGNSDNALKDSFKGLSNQYTSNDTIVLE